MPCRCYEDASFVRNHAPLLGALAQGGARPRADADTGTGLQTSTCRVSAASACRCPRPVTGWSQPRPRG
eukprot:scaffold1533_cov388-Prasinococcus_capsulatus_cf.AAC.7